MSYNNGARTITNGLVMAFDAANVKCFKGEPTTNLALFGIADGFNSDTPANIATGVDNSITYKGKSSLRIIASNGYWNLYKYPSGYYTQTSSAVFTFSWKMKRADRVAPNISGYLYTAAVSTYPSVTVTPIEDGWYQCYCTYNSTNSTPLLTGFNSSQLGIFYITDWQLEAKTYYTPFVSGSRGTTVATGGGMYDLSQTGNHGVVNNSPREGSDYIKSLILDGTNQYVSITPTANTIRTYDATVVFAVKLPLYSGGQRCILSYRGGGSGGQLYIGKAGGGIFCYYNELNNPGFTVGSITDGAPVIVAVVLNASGTTISTYINGSLAGSATRTGWVSTYNTVLNLGYDAGGTAEYMTGSLYYYAHYNRVLSAQEINSVYRLLKPRLFRVAAQCE